MPHPPVPTQQSATSSPQHLKALVLAGMIAMSASLKVAILLVGLKKLIEIAKLQPDPRHLQSQKRTRNILDCRLLELSN